MEMVMQVTYFLSLLSLTRIVLWVDWVLFGHGKRVGESWMVGVLLCIIRIRNFC